MKLVKWSVREWHEDVTHLEIFRADPTIEPEVIDSEGNVIEPEKTIPAEFDAENMPAPIATVEVDVLEYEDDDGVQGSLYRIAPVGLFT